MSTTGFIDGIVRVLDDNGEVVGTGFVVSDDGLIATCAHVVEAVPAGPGDVVAVHFQAGDHRRSARVVEEWWRSVQDEDVAFLRVEGDLPESVRSLNLGESSGTNDHKVRTFGFPEVGSVEGVWGRGEIVGTVTEGGHAWIQLRSSEITSGFSGGPVYDEARRRIIGMVVTIAETDTYSRLQETAFVISSETLQNICPVLKVEDICPYRGLLPFIEEDADFFFGRTALIDELTDQLRRNPDFLTLVGPSGSGTSSLIRAGLLPKIRNGDVPGFKDAQIVAFLPGMHPMNAFKEAAKELNIFNGDFDIWGSITSYLKEISDNRIVVVIDQLEELFALSLDNEREELLQGLSNLLNDHLPVTLITTLRADFYEALLSTSLGERLYVSQFNMQPMSEDELREVITMPAQVVGLQVEAGLIDLIIKDLKSAKYPLPLLEFALTQLWLYRKDNALTHEGYRKIGGVTGAVGEWATDVYNRLDDQEKHLCQRIFMRLIHCGEGESPDTRRRSTLSELTESEDEHLILPLINTLVDSRLLVTDRNPDTGVETVDIVHNSLLREWTQLREWIRDQRSFLIWRQKLDDRINDWNKRGRDESSLIRGSALTEAESWLKKHENDLSLTEQGYIQDSSGLRSKTQLREERRRRRVIFGLAAFSIVNLILAGFAAYQWHDIDEKNDQIVARSLASKSELILATSSDLSESIRCSVESLNISRTVEGDRALLHGLELLPCHLVRMPHDGNVNAAVFSPHGALLATGSCDNSVRIWNVTTGKELEKWYHDEDVNAVVFSPDGAFLATASCDNSVRIWNLTRGDEIWDLVGGNETVYLRHDEDVKTLVFSPDSALLATAGYDNTVRILEVSAGVELRRINYSSRVENLAFSPDGEMLATGDWDSIVRILDVSSGVEIKRMSHDDDVNALEFSPDGKLLATASWDSTARIWDVAAGREIARLNHEDNVWDVAFSPNGTLVATASDDKTARIWDIFTGKELLRLNHADDVCDVAFSPDGTLVATASDDNTAKLWIVASGKEYLKVNHQDEVNSVSFSPDGTLLLTASDDNTARVWKIPDEKFIPAMPEVNHDDHIHDLALCPGGKRLATASDDKTVKIWDVSTAEELMSFDHDDSVTSLAFTRRLLATACKNTTYIWDLATGNEFSRLNQECDISDVDFRPEISDVEPDVEFSTDGILLAVACSNVVYIWELGNDNNKIISNLTHMTDVRDVEFSPDGTLLATACDNAAHVWNPYTEDEILHLNHTDDVCDVAFSPDSALLAAACNSAAHIWNLASKKEISNLSHMDNVISVGFSPDGKFLATAGEDDTAKIWDLTTNEVVGVRKHDGDVNVVTFSPDGKYLVTGSSDKTARIWLWRPDDMICEAQCRLYP